MTQTQISLIQANVLELHSDLLILKFAQDYHGLDRQVAQDLNRTGTPSSVMRPPTWTTSIVETHNIFSATHVMFIGLPPVHAISYDDIRTFGRHALAESKRLNMNIETITTTIQGPGFGLDEIECALSQFSGLISSILAGDTPNTLKNIVIAELLPSRFQRFSKALVQKYSSHRSINIESNDSICLKILIGSHTASPNIDEQFLVPNDDVNEPKPDDNHRPKVFVAMPFHSGLTDVYHYGVQQPVHNSGYLCERIDESVYLGDIVSELKERIKDSAAVIAILNESNPNVYLEVGYAMGIGKPLIMIVNDSSELKFDVRNENCIVYESIQDLEIKLTRLLNSVEFNKGIGVNES